MIYLGGAWPREYRGSIFMNNIHGARLNRDILKPEGSGFVGSHAPDFLMANNLLLRGESRRRLQFPEEKHRFRHQ